MTAVGMVVAALGLFSAGLGVGWRMGRLYEAYQVLLRRYR